jgi:hypothetical protein
MINSKPNEPPIQSPLFNNKQYDLLKRCSDNADITEWNEWRKNNPKEEVLLYKAKLDGFNLQKADLHNAQLKDATFIGADLYEADLQNTKLWKVKLQGADLRDCNLQGTEICNAYLQNADFSRAIVDGKTLIWNCEIDQKTKFEGVGLGNIRIYPKEKQLLEYNIRRMNWEQWYTYKDWDKLHPTEKRNCIVQFLMLFVRLFWAISNYGLSTRRIIATFFSLAVVFAVIYWLCPEFIYFNNNINNFQNLWHACYFSVVTMTTLGFGDIAASPNSWVGQTLLMLQVILGYVLLGALVTRFAVLFTAGGLAGSLTLMDKASKQSLAKIKNEKGR